MFNVLKSLASREGDKFCKQARLAIGKIYNPSITLSEQKETLSEIFQILDKCKKWRSGASETLGKEDFRATCFLAFASILSQELEEKNDVEAQEILSFLKKAIVAFDTPQNRKLYPYSLQKLEMTCEAFQQGNLKAPLYDVLASYLDFSLFRYNIHPFDRAELHTAPIKEKVNNNGAASFALRFVANNFNKEPEEIIISELQKAMLFKSVQDSEDDRISALLALNAYIMMAKTTNHYDHYHSYNALSILFLVSMKGPDFRELYQDVDEVVSNALLGMQSSTEQAGYIKVLYMALMLHPRNVDVHKYEKSIEILKKSSDFEENSPVQIWRLINLAYACRMSDWGNSLENKLEALSFYIDALQGIQDVKEGKKNFDLPQYCNVELLETIILFSISDILLRNLGIISDFHELIDYAFNRLDRFSNELQGSHFYISFLINKALYLHHNNQNQDAIRLLESAKSNELDVSDQLSLLQTLSFLYRAFADSYSMADNQVKDLYVKSIESYNSYCTILQKHNEYGNIEELIQSGISAAYSLRELRIKKFIEREHADQQIIRIYDHIVGTALDIGKERSLPAVYDKIREAFVADYKIFSISAIHLGEYGQALLILEFFSCTKLSFFHQASEILNDAGYKTQIKNAFHGVFGEGDFKNALVNKEVIRDYSEKFRFFDTVGNFFNHYHNSDFALYSQDAIFDFIAENDRKIFISVLSLDYKSLIINHTQNDVYIENTITNAYELWTEGFLKNWYQVLEDIELGKLNSENLIHKLDCILPEFSHLAPENLWQNSSNNNNLIIIQDSILKMIPYGLISHEEICLLEKYNISYTNSLSELNLLQRKLSNYNNDKSLAIVIAKRTHLVRSDEEGGLDTANLEKEFISSWFPDHSITFFDADEGFSKEDLLDALPSHTYWHVIAHGKFMLMDINASFLSISDDQKITFDDILSLYGKKSSPRIVTLSSCETAQSDVFGFVDRSLSFQTAFNAVGAIGTIGTIWPVFSAASALIMMRFYELHIGSNFNPAQALKEAQLWLRGTTSEEFINYIEGHISDGRISEPSAQKLLHILKTKKKADECPFSASDFWGGFTLHGI